MRGGEDGGGGDCVGSRHFYLIFIRDEKRNGRPDETLFFLFLFFPERG